MKMMSQILNKLLSIAISDPDDDVREIMLGSLNKNFNSYLRHRSNLQSLILALNDSNDKVQKRAIVILRRLISSNASEIVPALQNSLYRILRVINMKSSDNEKDIIQNLKLLSCFISNAPFMLKNQRDLIFKFLLSPLQNQKTTQIVTTEIFATLSSLVCIAKSSTIRYFDQLIQVLLTSLEDMGSTKKRIEAIRCLSNVVRTSGLVVFVNYKYVSLNDLIFALFQVEANPEARSELMRLMGFLGALDCFNLFKVQSNTDLATLSTKELIDVIRSNHKSKFFFEKLVVSWQAPEDQCEFRLKEFFQNIINMNQVLDKGGVEEGLNQIIELNTIGTKGREDRDLLARTGPTPMVTQDSIKELLAMNDPITLGDTDSLLSYTTVVTLKTLLLNLFDQSLLLNHKFILDDLNMIVYTIGKEIAPYLYLLVPCLSHYISSSSAHLNREILELFEKILKICGHKFGEQSQRNVDLLIEIILKNLTVPKCKEKSLDTMIELIDSSNI
jgi:FKBP12-rapamycin complex-associated protein